MKYETYREYNPRSVALAEAALLSVWAGLGSYRQDIVLIGGLVPKYLCSQNQGDNALPRPATLDVNVGDVPASITPGISRALACARIVEAEGTDLQGARQKLSLRVCEAGPFLAMKLRAFARRQAPKDAFDILYTLLHYDRGTDASVTAFGEEVRVGNPACADAVACLKQHFRDEQSSAPVRASIFVPGQAVPGESEDIRFQRLQNSAANGGCRALAAKSLNRMTITIIAMTTSSRVAKTRQKTGPKDWPQKHPLACRKDNSRIRHFS